LNQTALSRTDVRALETRTSDTRAEALARLYDLDLAEDPGDLDLYLALANRTGGPIVELAVGTARIALPLAAAGHEVVGIDIDPAMLARARRHRDESAAATRNRLELVEADALALRPSDRGRFHLAILGLNSVLLFDTAERQERIVHVMAELLAPGGIAVIDAWQPQPRDLVRFDGRLSLEWLREDPETGEEVTKTAAAWYEPGTRRVNLTTIFDAAILGGAPVRWTRTDSLRLVSPDELERWAEAAGLEVEQVAGDHDLSPFGNGSERAILVARRLESRSG
jgi:SAM-dependent methyltransferase